MNEAQLSAALAEELQPVWTALRRVHPETILTPEDVGTVAQEMNRTRGRGRVFPQSREEVFSWLLRLAEGLHVRAIRSRRSGFRDRVRGLIAQVHREASEAIARLCRRMGVEGDDVMQDTYQKAVQHIADTDRLESLPDTADDALPWLIHVARNIAMDQRRTLSRAPVVSLAEDPMARELVAEPDEVGALRGCLSHLPPEERTVIDDMLTGVKPARIAEKHGLPVKDVYYRIRRAKVRLKECLTSAGGGDHQP